MHLEQKTNSLIAENWIQTSYFAQISNRKCYFREVGLAFDNPVGAPFLILHMNNWL